jgi:hypothetical protein
MFYTKNNYAFCPITKNASRFVTNHLLELGWKQTELSDNDNFIFFLILRDPYKRWISGLVKDIFNDIDDENLSQKISAELQSKRTWFLDWIFRTKTFDISIHTQLQTRWLNKKLLLQSPIYFNLENKLNFKLHHWLIGEGLSSNFLNLPMESKKHYTIYQNVETYLFDYKNQNKKELLLEYLQPDYNFINSIHFR